MKDRNSHWCGSDTQEMKTVSSSWYARLLARYSGLVLITISTLCVIAIICSLTLRDLPDFTDPQAGFETRGTDISRRLTAWENLLDSVSHVGPLTTNPLEAKGMLSRSKRSANKNPKSAKKNQKQQQQQNLPSPRILPQQQDLSYEYEDPYIAVAEPVISGYIQRRIGWLCGEPMPDYAHVVFRSRTNQSLFNWDSIISMCTVDSLRLRSQPQFKELCETKGPAHCCPGWSLGGYIGLLHKRSSCFGIKKSDVTKTLQLLKRCSPFYHSGELTAECLNNPRPCVRVPRECITHNAVYTILHYLTDHDFMSPRNLQANSIHLRYVMSFLPVARSSATLDYFHTLNTKESKTLGDSRTEIVAMDLGLKETLFSEYLIEDALYMAFALVLISLSILLYTQSMFITIATLLAIIYALSLAYFIYTFIFGIKFFPFMNILAVVIAIGVGADDTFILVKSWRSHSKMDPNSSSLEDHLESMVDSALSHSILTMCVTSLTTAAAFFASFISTITAIKCFSIFAGLAILCNLVLMVTWTPSALVFYTKHCQGVCCGKSIVLEAENLVKSPVNSEDKNSVKSKSSPSSSKLSTCVQHFKKGCVILGKLPRKVFEKWLPTAVIKPRFVWTILLGSLIVVSVMIVFYYPKLKLPDKEQFQLFKSSHIFERYDLKYKRYFGFEKAEQADLSYKMPLRFIWGIQPVDQGSHLNPGERGSLVLDSGFDISSMDSQRWMLKFCQSVRKQPFYKPTQGPLLSNCFMETFKEWMERRCKSELTGEDRAPCCQASIFPYTTTIFEKCLLLAIGDLYATPTDFWRPGVAGPKFNMTSPHRVEALIVEYDSNVTFSYSHEEMANYYKSVNDWFTSVIQNAPPQLRNGFFLSHLAFYDVQNSLLQDTLSAIGLALLIAVIVVFAATLNIGLSLLAVLTICGIIFVSMAILVFMGWKLNILESVAITLAIGLSVDFTLHYGVMYKKAFSKFQNSEIQIQAESSVIYAISHMGGPVTMAAFTTLLPGLCLLPSRVLAYIQIGTFIIVLMAISWLLATFFFLAILRIIGPSALTTDTIPEDTCCGQKLKQKDTWLQPKVTLKGHRPETEDLNEPAYYPATGTGYPSAVGGSETQVDLYEPRMNGSRVNTAESTITHVSNDTLEVVVTTIAAQVNPPVFKLPERTLMRSTISVNDDVFVPRILNEEDFQDGRVTLPIISNSSKGHLNRNGATAPPLDDSLPPEQEMDTPPPEVEQQVIEFVETNVDTLSRRSIVSCNNDTPKSRKSVQSDQTGNATETGSNNKHVQPIFEMALIHSDSPTIRADPVCSKRPMVELQPKIRRTGSSGTVIELLPVCKYSQSKIKSETVQIDLVDNNGQTAETLAGPIETITTTPSRKPQSTGTVIKPIIKNKINHHHFTQNIYYMEDPEQPPPPPPHSYEMQKIIEAAAAAVAPVYDDVPFYIPVADSNSVAGNNSKAPVGAGGPEVNKQLTGSSIHQIAPVPLPRKFEVAPPYREPPPPPLSAPTQVSTTTGSTGTEVNKQLTSGSSIHQQPPPDVVAEQVATCRRRRRSRQKSLPMAGELEANLQQQQVPQPLAQQHTPTMQQDYNLVQQQYHHTEEQMLCEVTSKARWNRSKSCHSRSNSLKKSKRKLAPDEDLITVVTDEPHHGHHGHHGHHFAHHDQHHLHHHPQPKPRTILTQVHRNGSASLGNILIIDPDQYLIDQSSVGDHFTNNANNNETEKTLRTQTLPRRHQQSQSPDHQLFPLENLQHSPGGALRGALSKRDPKPSPRSSSYHRHPLSHSTETILYTDDRYDPNPIIPNSTPDVPDIWLPMSRSVKA